jgi:hypothetical protein
VVLFGYNSSTDFCRPCVCVCWESDFFWVEKQEKTNQTLKRNDEEETGNFTSHSQGNGKHIKGELRRANWSTDITHTAAPPPHLVWRGGNPKCNFYFSFLNKFCFFLFFFTRKWKCPFHWHCSFCTSPTNVSFDHILHYVFTQFDFFNKSIRKNGKESIDQWLEKSKSFFF